MGVLPEVENCKGHDILGTQSCFTLTHFQSVHGTSVELAMHF